MINAKMGLTIYEDGSVSSGSIMYKNLYVNENEYKPYMQGNLGYIGWLTTDFLMYNFNDFDGFINFITIEGLSGLVDLSETAKRNLETCFNSEGDQYAFFKIVWKESKEKLVLIQNEFKEVIDFCFINKMDEYFNRLSPIQKYYLYCEYKRPNKGIDVYSDSLSIEFGASTSDFGDLQKFTESKADYEDYKKKYLALESFVESLKGIEKPMLKKEYASEFNRLQNDYEPHREKLYSEFKQLEISDRAFFLYEQKINFQATYSSYNIGSLCYAELMEIFKRGLIVKKCAIKTCNEYFIPEGRSDTLYCDSCRKNGAKLTYKQKVEEDIFLKLFNREYQRRYAKIRNYDKSMKKTKLKEVQSWVKKSKQKMDEPNLTIEQFEEWIEKEKESEKNGR